MQRILGHEVQSWETGKEQLDESRKEISPKEEMLLSGNVSLTTWVRQQT
jgi:hypothetical protein